MDYYGIVISCEACGEHPHAFDLSKTDHPISEEINRLCTPCISKYIEFLKVEYPECELLPFLTEWVPNANVQL